MKTFLRSFLASTLSLSALAVLPSACTVNAAPDETSNGPQTLPDGAVVQPTLPFVPSNITLANQDLSLVTDATVNASCSVDTDSSVFDCGNADAVRFIQQQPDGSQLAVFAFKSLTIMHGATVTVTGSMPAVFLAFGDMTISGSVVGKAVGSAAGPGGFTVVPNFSKGGGLGGGAAAIKDGEGPAPGTGAIAGIAAGGGSFCGLGGKGSMEGNPAGALTLSVPAPTPAYGNATLVPLVAGSSGGTGGLGGPGAGGGALQFVAAGAFSLASTGSIDVGGGGGGKSGETWGGQQAAGGGSGGAVLVEAMSANIDGTIAANGGGGGGSDTDGSDANASAVQAKGGTNGGTAEGGSGSSADLAAGTSGQQMTDNSAGAGGGGAGRIRINTNGALTTTGTLSPSPTSTCSTTGSVTLVAASGSDAGH